MQVAFGNNYLTGIFIEVYVNIHLQASLSEIERHDTSSVYHKLTLEALKELVPQIKWDVYLQVTIFTLSKHLFRCLSRGMLKFCLIFV